MGKYIGDSVVTLCSPAGPVTTLPDGRCSGGSLWYIQRSKGIRDLSYTVFCISNIFFGGLECPLLMSPLFLFLRDVWIRTQRAAVASRRATNLATHFPSLLTLYALYKSFLYWGISLNASESVLYCRANFPRI
jgi:hypothetical protein